jgi:hypothetical protein
MRTGLIVAILLTVACAPLSAREYRSREVPSCRCAGSSVRPSRHQLSMSPPRHLEHISRSRPSGTALRGLLCELLWRQLAIGMIEDHAIRLPPT